MEFTEFERMSTSLSQLVIAEDVSKSDWIVTEKIHGANFSFHVHKDGTVAVAKRRSMMNPKENFFSYKGAVFMKTYPEKMNAVYASVVKLFPEVNIQQVSVWGELFGGIYIVDGKDMKRGSIKPIQLEIHYCPQIEWIAYDISYRTEESPDIHEYIDYDVAMDVFAEHDVFHVKPLLRGTMDEVLSYDLNFDTPIPGILGLPPKPQGSNTAEGVVAKPVKNVKCMNSAGEEVRVIVKQKSAEFDKIKDTVPPPPKHAPGKKEKAQQEQKLMNAVLQYCTEHRLSSAISKHGFPSNEDIAKQVIDEFVADILMDVNEDDTLSQEFEKASDAAKKKIVKILERKAERLIKQFQTKPGVESEEAAAEE